MRHSAHERNGKDEPDCNHHPFHADGALIALQLRCGVREALRATYVVDCPMFRADRRAADATLDYRRRLETGLAVRRVASRVLRPYRMPFAMGAFLRSSPNDRLARRRHFDPIDPKLAARDVERPYAT
jgi:hypothetical protein